MIFFCVVDCRREARKKKDVKNIKKRKDLSRKTEYTSNDGEEEEEEYTQTTLFAIKKTKQQ
jgi:hypothetical protein